ncbi:MAG: hypothetical protein ABSD79_05320 [Dehalococcoidales bacterium]|jgi:hypothetical protein
MADEKMINQNQGENLLEFEVYTQSPVKTGKMPCPSIVRVLDLLNNLFSPADADDKSFLELMESGAVAGQDTPKLYFRKSAIDLIAFTDTNTGRGIGAAPGPKVYPFVSKMPRRVTIELHSYMVVGSVYCASDQSVMTILNERKAFLPVTDVVITNGSGFRGERPFVAINKHQIISLRENH